MCQQKQELDSIQRRKVKEWPVIEHGFHPHMIKHTNWHPVFDEQSIILLINLFVYSVMDKADELGEGQSRTDSWGTTYSTFVVSRRDARYTDR